MKKIRTLLVSLSLLSLISFPFCGFAGIDKLIVFGDSLSDNGNLYKATSQMHAQDPSIPIVPKSNPYFEGRFSNGPVWVEDLATLANLNHLVDDAFGGAWVEPTADSHQAFPIDVDQQVTQYISGSFTDFGKAKHLYILWAGANDYFNGNENGECVGKTNDDEASTKVVNILTNDVARLISIGAKNFLVLTMPDLGVIPFANFVCPSLAPELTQLSQQHNQKLIAGLQKLQQENPSTKIVTFDVDAIFKDLIAHPAKYNLTDVETPCYFGSPFPDQSDSTNNSEQSDQQYINVLANNPMMMATSHSEAIKGNADYCDTPDQYLYWDFVHPTRAIHQTLAQKAYELLQQNSLI